MYPLLIKPLTSRAYLKFPEEEFEQMERRVSDHDEILIELVQEIRKLIDAPKPKVRQRSIVFLVSDKQRQKIK